MASRTRAAATGLLLPAVLVTCWQLLGSAGLIRYDYLPPPGEVLAALRDLIENGGLIGDIARTLGATLTAAAISVPVGAAAGMAIGP